MYFQYNNPNSQNIHIADDIRRKQTWKGNNCNYFPRDLFDPYRWIFRQWRIGTIFWGNDKGHLPFILISQLDTIIEKVDREKRRIKTKYNILGKRPKYQSRLTPPKHILKLNIQFQNGLTKWDNHGQLHELIFWSREFLAKFLHG